MRNLEEGKKTLIKKNKTEEERGMEKVKFQQKKREQRRNWEEEKLNLDRTEEKGKNQRRGKKGNGAR